jgi:hypothetical protein
MLVASIVCFAIAAVGGLVMAFLHLSKKNAPIGGGVLHGLLAVAGVILLLVGMSQGYTSKLLTTALVLFVIAALGGLVLFTMHLRSRPLPVPILLVHALVAVGAFLTLLVGVLRHAA